MSDGFRPSLWETAEIDQVFAVTTVTRQMGNGPAMTVSVAVPDYDYFRGRGGKDVIPLYRDKSENANVDPNALLLIGDAHGRAVPAERLFAYVFAVLAGANYTSRFAEELATPGPRVPITRDQALFDLFADLGERLLWLQTFGERFGKRQGKFSISKEICWSPEPSRIAADNKDFKYDAMNKRLLVADGVLEGVLPEVWAFEVSGMQILKKWLGYRTAKGTGKAVSSSSPLDKIRPTEWEPEWSIELREVVHVLTETLRLQPEGISLLDRVLDGPLISADELPQPPDELRKPPKASAADGNELDFED